MSLALTLMKPERLWLLALVAALAGVYLWTARQRRHKAVRFSNFELLRSVAPAGAGWRRHVPAAGVGLAMAGLVLGLAGPARAVRIPKEAATVMLTMDMSASMQATDVSPSRYRAALAAARWFVEDLPDQVRVGLISFDRAIHVIATPTTDHDSVIAGIESLRLGPGTAAGDALLSAVDAIEAAGEAVSGSSGTASGGEAGAAIVLLSDGVTTIGTPVMTAAQEAADRGIPVSTIAFGTESGSVLVDGETVPVPSDPDTMEAVAELTSGRFFEADSADDLASVYEDIGTRVGYDTAQRDASGPVLFGGASALAAAFALSLLWNGRLV